MDLQRVRQHVMALDDASCLKEDGEENVQGLKFVAELAMQLLEVCVNKVESARSQEVG
jgi:hypothetical protein